MVTIKDVAKKAGVSISTVSNVMNDRKNVGKETRARVLEICKELGYYPHGAGRMLKTKKSDVILFTFSDFDRRFYLDILKGISDCVHENGYDLAVSTEKSYEKFVRSNLNAGSIILDSKVTDEELLKLASKHHPIVVMDRMIEHPNIHCLLNDNYPPIATMMSKLIGRGCKRFAYIGGMEGTFDHSERFGAFMKSLAASKIVFDHSDYYCGDYREAYGYKIAKVMILEKRLPEVIVCGNDNMAVGVVKSLMEEGIKVPDDVMVTGFDNDDTAEAYGITTVDVPKYESGYLAAKKLINMLSEKEDGQLTRIEGKVIFRRTTHNV